MTPKISKQKHGKSLYKRVKLLKRLKTNVAKGEIACSFKGRLLQRHQRASTASTPSEWWERVIILIIALPHVIFLVYRDHMDQV